MMRPHQRIGHQLVYDQTEQMDMTKWTTVSTNPLANIFSDDMLAMLYGGESSQSWLAG